MDREPVFAFHKSLRHTDMTTGPKSVLFTIAFLQDSVVQYAAARGMTAMRPLWKSWFLADTALITFHYMDYVNTKRLAGNYSTQLARDAYQHSSHNYMDIVALSARQVIGSTCFGGTADDPLLFLKEISSDGNAQTVDVIFPAFPFFLYTNSRWLGYLLEPLLEHQLSGQYPNNYSMHDLGFHYPNLTGHEYGKDEYMPVEECGDMLIMGLALANSLRHDVTEKARYVKPLLRVNEPQVLRGEVKPFALRFDQGLNGMAALDESLHADDKGKTLAKEWVRKSYPIWKQWTEYLIDYALEPENQREWILCLHVRNNA